MADPADERWKNVRKQGAEENSQRLTQLPVDEEDASHKNLGHESLPMPCKSCGANQRKFSAEMCIHFPGLGNIGKPAVFVFPELLVCLYCGTAEFAVPEAKLRLLAKDAAAAAG